MFFCLTHFFDIYNFYNIYWNYKQTQPVYFLGLPDMEHRKSTLKY
jgi:ssDNA-specific exonuclease RecJ